jgi:hypothetical protein
MTKYSGGLIKEVGLFLALFAFMLLFSCNVIAVDPATAVAASDRPFTATAGLRFGDFETELKVYRKDGNRVYMQLLSPPAVNGMVYTFEDGTVEISHMGLLFKIHPEQFPAESAAHAMMNAIGFALDAGNVEVSNIDGIYLFKSLDSENYFEMTVDSSTGKLLRLTMPKKGLEFEFRDFKFVDD